MQKSPFHSTFVENEVIYKDLKTSNLVLFYSASNVGKSTLLSKWLNEKKIEAYYFDFENDYNYLINNIDSSIYIINSKITNLLSQVDRHEKIYDPALDELDELMPDLGGRIKNEICTNENELLVKQILSEVNCRTEFEYYYFLIYAFKNIEQKTIVFDTLQHIIPPSLSVNSNDDMFRFMSFLNTIAERFKKLVIFVHHTKKGIKSSDLESFTGSNNFKTQVDFVFKLNELERNSNKRKMQLVLEKYRGIRPTDAYYFNVDENLTIKDVKTEEEYERDLAYDENDLKVLIKIRNYLLYEFKLREKSLRRDGKVELEIKCLILKNSDFISDLSLDLKACELGHLINKNIEWFKQQGITRQKYGNAGFYKYYFDIKEEDE